LESTGASMMRGWSVSRTSEAIVAGLLVPVLASESNGFLESRVVFEWVIILAFGGGGRKLGPES